MKMTEFLSKEEIYKLVEPSDLKGWQALLTTWGMICSSFALVALYPSLITILFALVILGGRHLALAILMHDCAHYSLFRTHALNDFIGKWLCAYPSWQDLRRYRTHHLAHHKYAGTDKDPDFALVAPFPVSRSSLIRKFVRDISGISGLKRIYGILLMDLGFIQYTVSSDVIRLDQAGRTLRDVLMAGAKNLHGVAITNVILFGVLAYLGHAPLYLLWVGSYLTTFSLFLRVRSIAEHACTETGTLDPFRTTRTTYANWLARITVAPHYVNYHLEHHLLMTVPHFRFRGFHFLLRTRGALKTAYVVPGYLSVLKQASKD